MTTRETLDDVRTEIAERLEALSVEKEKAALLAQDELEKRVDQGQAIELSDDELQMIKAYRRFCASHEPGDAFGWKTPMCDHALVLPTGGELLRHPREVACARPVQAVPDLQPG